MSPSCALAVANTSCLSLLAAVFVSELQFRTRSSRLSAQCSSRPFPPTFCGSGQQANCPVLAFLGRATGAHPPPILAKSSSLPPCLRTRHCFLQDLLSCLPMTLSRLFMFLSLSFAGWNICKMELMVMLTFQAARG